MEGILHNYSLVKLLNFTYVSAKIPVCMPIEGIHVDFLQVKKVMLVRDHGSFNVTYIAKLQKTTRSIAGQNFKQLTHLESRQ